MYDSLTLVREVLKKKGYKITKQREEILKCLYNFQGHITIERMYDMVKKHGVGLSTIYRNLDIFKNTGIINEINIDDKNYYEPRICKNRAFHIHFKCSRCGAIIDMDDNIILDKVFELNLSLQNSHGISIENVNIIMMGSCSKCQEGENI